MTAAFRPSWASETTSLTPLRPRRVSLRRNSVQIGSASEVPTSMPSTSRRPVATNPPESRATGMLSIGQMEGINSTFCQADRISLHRYDFNIPI